jgi:5'-nucleotidase
MAASFRRRGLTIAGVLAMVALALFWARPGATGQGRPPDDVVTLSIVATNDLHGGLLPRDGRGGVEALGGYVANLRAARAADGDVLLVDAGDMFQGTLESNLGEGAAVVAAYNALGYAAAAIGNHEFDFGVAGPGVGPASTSADPRGALKARAAEAMFPFLAANLIDAETGRAVEWPNVRRSVTVERAGVRVGIIGVMTANALSATIATTTGGLRVAPLAPAIASEAAALRRDGAAVVIVAAHAGGRCLRFDDPRDLSSCDLPDSEIIRVVRELPKGSVDVIASGHTHGGVAHEVDGTVVMQAFSGGAAFSRADLSIDRAAGRVVAKRVFPPRDLCTRVYEGTTRCDEAAARKRPLVPAVYEGRPVQPDDTVARVIAPAIEAVRDVRAEPLGVTLEEPIRRAAVDGESPLGNLFTDAMLAAIPGADVAINNTRGGLRADLPAGPLTYGRLYETFPFEDRLVTLTLTGAELLRVVRTQLQQARAVPGIAGIRVRAACRGRDLSVSLLRPSGQAVAAGDRLTIVTTDFLAAGGDRLLAPVMPRGGFPMASDLPVAREVVADALRRRGGTLAEEHLINRTDPRWRYPGPIPVRCR